MYFKSKFKDSFERGSSFEATAMSVLRNNGHEVTPSSELENKRQHIDFWAVGKDCKRYSFDAKAMRSLFRGGPKQDVWVVIEWRNVFGGLGSIYGDQDFFIFERARTVEIIRREDLLLFGKANVDLNKKSSFAKDAKYCAYTRSGRKDLISLVSLDDFPFCRKRVLDKFL